MCMWIMCFPPEVAVLVYTRMSNVAGLLASCNLNSAWVGMCRSACCVFLKPWLTVCVNGFLCALAVPEPMQCWKPRASPGCTLGSVCMQCPPNGQRVWMRCWKPRAPPALHPQDQQGPDPAQPDRGRLRRVHRRSRAGAQQGHVSPWLAQGLLAR